MALQRASLTGSSELAAVAFPGITADAQMSDRGFMQDDLLSIAVAGVPVFCLPAFCAALSSLGATRQNAFARGAGE